MKLFLTALFILVLLPLYAGDKVHQSIPVSDFQKVIKKEEGTLLDVRSPKEHKAAALADSSLMNFFEEGFWDKLAQLPKEKT